MRAYSDKRLINTLSTMCTHILHKELKITTFSLIAATVNLVLYYWPFWGFVNENVDCHSLNGIVIISSLGALVLIANAWIYYLIASLSRIVSKIWISLTFLLNAIAVYFINTYHIVIDKIMMGNVFNTNYSEASGFLSFKILFYIVFLGILPAALVCLIKTRQETVRRRLLTNFGALLFIVVLSFANVSNWLWIDKHSTKLGALTMPWSYIVNTARFYIHKHQENTKEILLPDATVANNDKTIFVLVIGESARSQNFSLYGYNKPTNPLLDTVPNLHCFRADAYATYTTASVKCILSHTETSDLYEILPNYLYRNGAEVIWRTSNWGEPPIHISHYQRLTDIASPNDSNANYDETLLHGLKAQIEASDNHKILVILHTSTSHGPQYYQKYPPRFETFKPACKSVELSKCTHEELINAYDNTIVYTDYLLHCTIEMLRSMHDYKSAMLYVSDHGESLGEKNLYMHGMPLNIAPREQYEIPFIVWTSDSTQLKPAEKLTQHHVFHSVLHFLGFKSPIYNNALDIFE